MHRIVTKIIIAPQNLAGPVEARRAMRTEMHVDLFTVDNRGWAGWRVLGVNRLRGGRFGGGKDFRVPERLAGCGVETKRAKRRPAFAALNARSKKDPSFA